MSDPEDTLRAAAEAVMREVVGDRTVDEVADEVLRVLGGRAK